MVREAEKGVPVMTTPIQQAYQRARSKALTDLTRQHPEEFAALLTQRLTEQHRYRGEHAAPGKEWRAAE